jgi:hypothetical protein
MKTTNPMPRQHLDALIKLGACGGAVAWFADRPTPQAAWNEVMRGDWMLWLCGRLSGEVGSRARKKLVLCVCECARLALPHTEDARVLACIETAERYVRGKATLAEVRATYAASTVAYAACAASAAYAAYSASSVAYSAACVAHAASSVAARKTTLRECAAIVRKHYPEYPLKSVNQNERT